MALNHMYSVNITSAFPVVWLLQVPELADSNVYPVWNRFELHFLKISVILKPVCLQASLWFLDYKR